MLEGICRPKDNRDTWFGLGTNLQILSFPFVVEETRRCLEGIFQLELGKEGRDQACEKVVITLEREGAELNTRA